MHSYPQSRSSLLRLLAILEWVSLGTVILAQIPFSITNSIPVSTAINYLGLGIIAGLRLIPPQGQRGKLAYTVMEFGLVFSLGFIGNVPLPAMLFIVLVIRSCLRLEGQGRAIATELLSLAASFSRPTDYFIKICLLKCDPNELALSGLG